MKIIPVTKNGECITFNFDDETKASKFFASLMENTKRDEIWQINIVFE